jgi:hypothetical protein
MFCVYLSVTAALNIWIYCFHSFLLWPPSRFTSIYVNSFSWTSPFLVNYSLFILRLCLFLLLCTLFAYVTFLLWFSFLFLPALVSSLYLLSFLLPHPLSHLIFHFFPVFRVYFPYNQQYLKGGMSKYSCREGVWESGVYLHAFSNSVLVAGKCLASPPVLFPAGKDLPLTAEH